MGRLLAHPVRKDGKRKVEYRVSDNTYGIADFQTELLTILHEFMKICEKYHLRWWASGGTCIGVLRHNGFVPWDDDLGVAMPRPDYEKLWSLREEINKDSRYIITRTGQKKLSSSCYATCGFANDIYSYKKCR